MGDVPPPEGDLSALSASLQSDARDSKVFFGVLCSTFENALPESTVVEREHSLFNKAKRVARRLTVQLGDDTFTAEMHEGQLLCRQVHAVHGIHGGMPYTKDLTVQQWMASVLAAVTADARASAAATDTLRSLLT